MHYKQYYPIDVMNGPGTRATLFVSGCLHQCDGCYNQSTWSPRAGEPYTEAMEDQIIKDLTDTRIKRRGLSLSGGDPLYHGNLEPLLRLVKRVRLESPGSDIWLWTGHTYELLTPEQRELVDLVDCVVDGKYVKELADYKCPWKGSTNQRVIDIGTGTIRVD